MRGFYVSLLLIHSAISNFCAQVNLFEQYIPEAFPHGNDLIIDAEVLLIDTRTGEPLPFGTLGKHKVTLMPTVHLSLVNSFVCFNSIIFTEEYSNNMRTRKLKIFAYRKLDTFDGSTRIVAVLICIEFV